MLKCNDVHANENVKAMGYAVCKNQKYLRHVMLHDGLMPMHNAKQKKIEPLHRFFFTPPYTSPYASGFCILSADIAPAPVTRS